MYGIFLQSYKENSYLNIWNIFIKFMEYFASKLDRILLKGGAHKNKHDLDLMLDHNYGLRSEDQAHQLIVTDLRDELVNHYHTAKWSLKNKQKNLRCWFRAKSTGRSV